MSSDFLNCPYNLSSGNFVFVHSSACNFKNFSNLILPIMSYKNNPFNIRYTGQQWKGLSGHRNGFCEFQTIEYGIRAWIILMRTYRRKYNICTIRKIVARFAPPVENGTDAYINFVSKYSCLPADHYLNFDMQYCAIAHCMAKIESSSDILSDDVKNVMEMFNLSIVS